MLFQIGKAVRAGRLASVCLAGSLLILLCGIGGLIWTNSQEVRSAQIPLTLEILLSTLTDAETGQRGYLLTGEDQYLEPYRAALAIIPQQLDAADPAIRSVSIAASLHDLVTKKLAELATTVSVRQSGQVEQALDMVKTNTGKRTMDDIRSLIARGSEVAKIEMVTKERQGNVALGGAVAGGIGLFGLGLIGIVKVLQVRNSLVASEARLRLLVAGIHDHAIYMLDENGRILTWNTGAERLKGFSAAEAIGQPYAMLFSPDDRASKLPDSLLAEARVLGAVESEGVRVRRDGSTFTAHISLTAIFDEAATLRGYCKVARNVTEQRAAEMVLARDHAELEELVEARSRTLHETQTRLAHVQRMEALGQLAGGIAHDFNNVLQAVQSCAQLIEGYSTDIRVRRLANTAGDATERGSAITRRLLAFSRRGDLRTEAVDPDLLLADIRELLAHTLGTGVKVVVEAPRKLPMMSVDKGQLETVLINVATNARDAMSGTGVITLAAAADEVGEHAVPGCDPDGLKPGAYIRLSLTDTGVGMAPEVLARVTEPFFTTKPVGKGTGLGLAMARGFAEQSGGALRIKSVLGKGTTVTLWLPLAEEEATQREVMQPTTMMSAAKTKVARIVLVDDDQSVREVLTLQLEAAGYAVLATSSGPQALAALDAGEEVDLIVSDLSMPEMDGITCIREAHQRRRGLPAILLTGFATNTAEIAVQGALTNDFTLVRKPVSARYLVERIERLLDEANTAPAVV